MNTTDHVIAIASFAWHDATQERFLGVTLLARDDTRKAQIGVMEDLLKKCPVSDGWTKHDTVTVTSTLALGQVQLTLSEPTYMPREPRSAPS
jgi:hypothetical protein